MTSGVINKTTYFLDSGDKVIIEDINSLAHKKAVTGKFSYEVNEKYYFLNNTLNADFSWDSRSLDVKGNINNSQHAERREGYVNNLLKVIKRFNNNKLVTFTSRNKWSSLPEKLKVVRNDENYGERIKQNAFFTDERAALGFVFKPLYLSLNAGISAYLRNLNTDLFGLEILGQSNGEELTTNYLRVFASPKLEWNHRKIGLTFDIPVNFYSYFFSGGISNRVEYFVSPSLTMRYQPTPSMAMILSGSLRRSPASLHDIHDSSILTDYRSFNAGVDDYYSTSGQSVAVAYTYSNILNGLSLRAMGNYGWNKSKAGMVQNIVGDYIFHSYRSRPSDSGIATALIHISKTLDFMGGSVSLNSNYNRISNNIVSQGTATAYKNDSFRLNPDVRGNISGIINWNLRFTWDKSWLYMTGLSGREVSNYIYSGSVALIPCDILTFYIGGEYYRNSIVGNSYKDLLMLDSKLTFNVGKRFEISASVTNILNHKTYSYTTYGALAQHERSSILRGREFMISVYLKK